MAPQSALVEQIRLALIKMVTANPRLVVGQFDEQTRKQFATNKPEMNPFGDEEDARPFRDMDLFTKVFTEPSALSPFCSCGANMSARSRSVCYTNFLYGLSPAHT